MGNKPEEDWSSRDQAIVDAQICGDTAEAEVLKELRRLGIENELEPDVCPECGGKLEARGGMVGETMLWCFNEACDASCVWTDTESAIRRVY